jgi:ankyrin repeat protein
MANNPILTAAKQGQWHLVKRSLPGASAEQINGRDSRGLTALMYGVAALEIAVVQQLLEAGADVNLERPPHRITSLMVLAGLPHVCTDDRRGKEFKKNLAQIEIAKLLIEFGAELNQGNDDGTTALMMAAYRNNNSLVKILLEAGADPNLQDQQGTTTLEWAIKHENLPMVQNLLKRGVQLDLTDGQGNLPLTLAMQRENQAVISYLFRAGAPWDQDSWFTAVEQGQINQVLEFIQAGYPVAEAGEMGDTALHIACLEGHGQIVELLLQNQVSLDVANQAGDTPLQLAIAQGQLAIVEQLLRAGANANFSVTGESPLLTALITEDLTTETQREIVEALLVAGVLVNQPLWEDKTPLMVAANLNLTAVIAVLSNHGADPNQVDPSGSTALMWACHRGDLDTVKALLDNFPTLDINKKNKGGQTALDLAQLNHQQAIVALLKSHQSHG